MADYGEWMNNLAGMTNALGAASPYAQQLALNNAQQENLARIIRAGGFSGPYGASSQFGGNYPTQTGAAPSGVSTMPSQAPTPFTGFADILARNAAQQQARAQAQAQAQQAYAGAQSNYEQDGGAGEGSYGVNDGTSIHYDNFKDWFANMRQLPEWASQFTPSGMARDIYKSGGFDPLLSAIGLNGFTAAGDRIDELSSPDNNFGQPRITLPQDEVSKWARALAQAAEAEQWGLASPPPPPAPQLPPAEIISRSPYALGGTYPTPAVETEQLGILAEPSPIPVDEVYQAWLADQINAGNAQEESGPQWWSEAPEYNYNFDTGQWEEI